VPARRKFLKTDQTEAAHIVHCVRLYALACPGAAFTLIEDGRLIFRSPECRTLEQRIAEIFGRQLAEGLVPIECVEPGLRLGGLIGRPGVGRATRHEMIVFVNARPVDSRTLNYALIESYSESLPKGRYPLAFVFFECDPAAVDVNVHPAKREVRFRSESQVRGFVIRAVLQRLRELAAEAAGGIADFGSRSADSGISGHSGEAGRRVETGDRKPETGNPERGIPAFTALHRADLTALARPVCGSELSGLGFRSPVSSGLSGCSESQSAIRHPQLPPSDSAWRFVGLAHGNYALFETSAGVVLLDRRAAHERVWFERLREEFRAGTVPSQRLLLPVPIELDAIAAALLVDRLKFLNEHGFELAEFGRNFFRVEAVPVWMEPADAEAFLRDLLGAFREGVIPTKTRISRATNSRVSRRRRRCVCRMRWEKRN
jgi:DNA mismatch repair protein MutL